MSESIEQIRQKAAKIASRFESDEQFKAQVLSDPEATLVAAGLPAGAIPEFLAEQGISEVSAYCWAATCMANSQCVNTFAQL